MTNEASNPNDETDRISPEEFAKRVASDPEFSKALRKAMEWALELPDGPETAATKESARVALAAHAKYDVAGKVCAKMMALKNRAREVEQSRDWEGIRELNTRLDEIVDDALDFPEPYRAGLMVRVTDFQAKLREIEKGM